MTPPADAEPMLTAEQRSQGRRAMAMLLCLLAMLSMLGPFNIDMPFPAFGRIGTEFGASTQELQLIVTSYMVAFAVMSPFHGPLSDALGRKPVIIGGLVLTLLATVGCAVAPNLPALLGFRVLQGLTAGAGVIVSRTVIRDLFDGPRAQVLMSRVLMIFGIAPAIAPILGGWLLYTGTWRAIFWFMVVIIAAMIVMVARFLPESHPADRRTSFKVSAILANLGSVAKSREFHQVSWAASFGFGGQFLYVGAAPIFVIDLLGKGEQDFWIFFVPMIAGVTFGAWISSRAAGRISRVRLVTGALCFSLGSAGLNVLLAMAEGPSLPWAVMGPMLIAIGTGIAYPVQQLMLLDMFPNSRGGAVSMFTFFTLSLNGLNAALLAPHVTDSVVTLAVASLGLELIASSCWATYVIGRRRLSAATRA